MTPPTAHPELADLARSLGYTYLPPTRPHAMPWWEARLPDGRLVARVVVEEGGHDVHAFTDDVLIWSATLTDGTPAAVLAAVMAVAAAEVNR